MRLLYLPDLIGGGLHRCGCCTYLLGSWVGVGYTGVSVLLTCLD